MLEDVASPKASMPLSEKQRTLALIVVIVVIALIPSIYFYTQYQKAASRIANPNEFAAEETKRITAAVAKLMTLPSGETPTMATVNDVSKLKNQPFFANAQNGDKVLIYSNAKKAILYRPDLNKIIDVAPVNLGAATASAEVAGDTTTKEAPVTVVLLNGTTVVGLTRQFETGELKTKVPNAQVTDRDNAKKTDYEKSILVDVTGTQGAQAAKIANALGISVGRLPEGEATPSGDFLIILGADKK